MNCEQARELIGAEPEALSAELREHLSGCPDCTAYRAQMLSLEANIRRALELPLAHFERARGGERAAGSPLPLPLPPRAAPQLRGWAIAASVVAGLLLGAALWFTRPQATLAAEVVTHVEGEPQSWLRTEPISGAELDAMLRKTGVRMDPDIGQVVYASSCRFRGRLVPHMVLLTPSGPVTVMILQHERVKSARPFDEDGFSGLLVPAQQGSIAILSRTPMALEPPAQRVLTALRSSH